MRFPGLAFAFVVMLAGCGEMAGTGEMRAALGRGMAEDQNHLSLSSGLTTMPAMVAEMDRHTSRMASIIDDMSTDMMSMPRCLGTQSMMDLRDEMRGELDGHTAAMQAITSVDDARDEVGHHVRVMDAMLHDMDTMLCGMHCGGW